MNLKGSRIQPCFYGCSGGRICHIPKEFDIETGPNYPHIIIVDMAQNDLCNFASTPAQIAQEMNSKLLELFDIYDKTELIVVCQVTPKTSMYKSPKPLKTFNEDVEKYNYHLLRATRANHRIVRWCHRGMLNPIKPVTKDGTHPDTKEGQWKYHKSMAAVCRWAKEQLLERRVLSKWALKKKRKIQKMQKQAKKACK